MITSSGLTPAEPLLKVNLENEAVAGWLASSPRDVGDFSRLHTLFAILAGQRNLAWPIAGQT